MRIILGKSKTGKSSKIYEQILEDINNGKDPILFVPSQTREITEINYMKQTNKSGIIDVNITTISEFVSDILKKRDLHLDENYLSKLDKKLIISDVVSKNSDKLKVFKNVKSKDGFLDLMNIYIDLFRKNKIDNLDLNKIGSSDSLLLNKTNEIYYLYEKYKERVDEKYVDTITQIDILNQNIMTYKDEFENSTIYFDGYNNFTTSEYEFIKSLLKLELEVTISINTDIVQIEDIYTQNTNDIFEVSNKTYLNLLKIANSCKNVEVETEVLYTNFSKADKSILYLADNVFEPIKKKLDFKDDSININIYSNVYKEIEAVAYQICKKRKNGYRYNDIAIYTTNIEDYESVIARIFYEYGIPLFADTKRKIQTSRIVEYLIEILEMASKNMNFENIISLLKKGLNDFDLDKLYYLENYVLEFNINKYSTLNDFYLNNDGYNEIIYDLEELNSTRKEIINIFYNTIENLKKASSAKDIVNIIYDHFTSNDILLNYYNLAESIEDQSYFLYSSKADVKIWEKICEVFNSICKIYSDSNIKIDEFSKLFKMVISEVYIKSVPPTKDKVMLADINVSKPGKKAISFFVGVTEGNFPKKYDEDILFSDREIEKLDKYGIDFKETSISKENMGRYNIYEVLNNTNDYLYISMPAIDIQNETTRKSSFISDVENTITINVVGEVTSTKDLDIKYDDIFSTEKCFEYMTKKLRYLLNEVKNIDNVEDKYKFKEATEEILSIYEYFCNNPKYKEIIEYLKNDDNLSDESINSIYKDEFKSSVYKLEQFKKCPFSYYMKYVLNINKRKVYEITSMDTGSIMHGVIDIFSKYLLQNDIKWSEVLEEDGLAIKKVYKDKVIDIIENLLNTEFKKQKESVKYGIYKRKLQNTMSKVITIIARGFRQSKFEMLGNEIEFNDKSVYLPMVLELSNGVNMKIIGKIDRVDILKREDTSYVRVVDYKSSQKNLSVSDIMDGLSLQLITYLTSMIENVGKDGNVVPAGCLYFNLSDKLINLKDYTKDEDKIKEEMLKKLRMTGLFVKDMEILECMDSYVSDPLNKLIDITPNRMSNSKKALEQEEFENLCKETKNILRGIGNEIVKGVVSINPNKHKEACKYCDFASVCRKDSCI